MSPMAMLLLGVAAGVVLGVAGSIWARYRAVAGPSGEVYPAGAHQMAQLLVRVHGAAAVCIVTVDSKEPVWAKGPAGAPHDALDKLKALVHKSLQDGRYHMVQDQHVMLARGDHTVACGILWTASEVAPGVTEAALEDLRVLVADFRLARARERGRAVAPAKEHDWLTPVSVHGIGAGLCEAISGLTGRPTAVVARDWQTQEATVIAVSSGLDPRLLHTHVVPSSVVGRACLGDLNVVGSGRELFGPGSQQRRQREEEGVVYSLRDGSQGVGAVIVFGSIQSLSEEANDAVQRLTAEAGPLLGHATALQVAMKRNLTDELTGESNQQGLDKAMRDQVWGPCSLLCMKIDGFDQFDSPMGNAALRHIARILRDTLRDYDVPARIDDSVFGVFLPDTPLHYSLDVAGRLRAAVGETVFEWGGKKQKLTCSCGVAAVPEAAQSPEGLREAAGLALQAAISQGANQISAAPPQLN